ncbi:unnamed protein product [Caenorhabditis auriculariae]|uniref:SWIM-type domain-containing protein n=1 Tax=Caenorhabditis auriculariae TaxID=2777116 RepID=A0A8S1GZ81_9PELO|nr:unnamed protein product [Caenorhabditis auriculariae]
MPSKRKIPMTDDSLCAFSILNEIFRSTLKEFDKECKKVPTDVLPLSTILEPKIFSAGIQLAEKKLVKAIIPIKQQQKPFRRRARPKTRKYSDFVVRDPPKKDMPSPNDIPIQNDEKMFDNVRFFEVVNNKSKYGSEFVLPSANYCTCKYFQVNVLKMGQKWICAHLIAARFGLHRGTVIEDKTPEKNFAR